MSRYMDPTTDFGFKKIFASEQSTPVLKSFLFNLLGLETPIAALSFLPLEQLPGHASERIGIYDIYCITEKIEIAEKLIQLQVPIQTILQATGLTEEELEAISDPKRE